MLETHPKLLSSKRLLVVENDIDFRDTIQKGLEKDGAKVLVAKGVDEASRILKEQPVDFVLSDIQMPMKSGFDLLRWCDSTGITASGRPVPFALMTGSAEEQTEKAAEGIGACSLLKKPFTHEDLVNVILRSTERSNTEENKDQSFSYIPIPISELASGAKEVRFPLYLIQDVGRSRYISHGLPERLAESSAALTAKQADALQRSGIDRVFIRARDSFRFFGFASKIECYSEREASKKHSEWATVLNELESAITFYTSRFKMDAVAFRYSVTLTEAAIKLFLHSKDLEGPFMALKNDLPERFRSALNSSLLSVSVMTMMGWESLPVRLQMAFSAVLIEIFKNGKISKIPPDIVSCISETVMSTTGSKEVAVSGVKFKVPPLVSILQTSRNFSDHLVTLESSLNENLFPQLKNFAQAQVPISNPNVIDAAMDFLAGGKIRKHTT